VKEKCSFDEEFGTKNDKKGLTNGNGAPPVYSSAASEKDANV
jgi:hypothetical protein